jgi:cytoskeletal protein CcmA (bactofilin family)
VGPGARFEGVLAFRGEARVEGEVVGAVEARGTLVVGPQAVLRADVEAEEVVVAGVIEGDVAAARRLALLAGGRVAGSVRTARLSLADGSVLDGRCRTLGDAAFDVGIPEA